MFSRAKKQDEVLAEVDLAPSVPEPGPTRKASAKNAPRPKPVKPAAGVPSLISADVVIRGTIESEGEVQFDGEIEGDIRAKGLVIGEGARVSGEVVADKVRVSGTVDGAIRATRVELASGALVKGDIIHTALAIEAGARFEGNVRHSDDPTQADVAPTPARRPAPIVPEPAPVEPALAETGSEAVQELETAEPIARTIRRAKPDLR